VNPADFTGHFRFTPKNAVGWQVLNTPPASDDAIPAVVDQNTLLWALQKQLGDTLEYQDEQGRNVRLRLVAALDGTVLQGSVVIAEEQFTRLFPNDGGYRAFFVEATPQKSAAVRQELTKALADRGLSLTEATVRLDELHAVENTFLAIFQSLAGLALLLGTAGVGIVVGRNVVERRSEFALLEAVGYPPELVRHTVVLEHGFLVWMALLIGGVSAAVAMIPHLSGAVHGDWPWQGSLGLLLALGVLGSIWVFGTTRILLKGSSVKSLRAE
jgi:ABC-type antimicrobial peptide transport system permease subunit